MSLFKGWPFDGIVNEGMLLDLLISALQSDAADEKVNDSFFMDQGVLCGENGF